MYFPGDYKEVSERGEEHSQRSAHAIWTLEKISFLAIGREEFEKIPFENPACAIAIFDQSKISGKDI